MTVDEILATGRYESRRGYTFERCREDCPGAGLWVCEGRYEPGEHLRTDQVAVEVERDMHRDECCGLYGCHNHPVPKVTRRRTRSGFWVWSPFDSRGVVSSPPSHVEAMSAARALAVRE